MNWYHSIPKIELHVHLEGSIPHEALFDLVQKYGGDPYIPNVDSLTKRFTFNNFSQFIEAWTWKNQFLREYDDFTFIAQNIARDMANQNIRYAEMFFSPSIFSRQGLRVQELTLSIRKGLLQVPEIEISLIADLVRDYGPIAEMKILNELNEVKDYGIVGISIGGSEPEFPPEPFEALFNEARNMGFNTSAHAGEASGPQSVWSAITKLHIQRIGHGTTIHEDPTLLEHVISNSIPVECCPVSNVRTGVVADITDHPIRRYYDKGVIVSVNTDDPKMFNTSLAHEYSTLSQHCGFSKQDIVQLIINGIQSSWLSIEKKNLLIETLKQDPSWG